MKTLIIVADLGHASPRIPNLGAEMDKMGFEVKFLCPKMTKTQKRLFGLENIEKNKFIETSFRSTYKIEVNRNRIFTILLKVYRKITDFRRRENIEPYKGFAESAIKALTRVDLISSETYLLSSSSPFAMHTTASEIKEKISCKWIADFRDPWSENHAKPEMVSRSLQGFEKEVIKAADFVITVSEGFSEKLARIHNREVKVIRNGYKDLKEWQKLSTFKVVKFGYFGQVYPKHQSIIELLELLNNLNFSENQNWEFHFFGTCCVFVKEYFEKSGFAVPYCVRLHGNIELESAIKAQAKMDILFFLDWRNDESQGVIPTKFMEYLGSGRPIISIGGQDNSECNRIILETQTGLYFQKFDVFRKFLRDLPLHSEGVLKMTPNANLLKYSFKNQAIILKDMINNES